MDGKLVAVAGGAKSIMVYDGQGNGTIFAREIAGNDIAVKSDGSCYVTAPGPGNKSGDVFYVSPAGEVKQVDSGLKFANGVTFSPIKRCFTWRIIAPIGCTRIRCRPTER